jgi:hypothetical protein
MKILLGDSIYNLGFLSGPEENSQLKFNAADQTLVRREGEIQYEDNPKVDVPASETILARGEKAEQLWRLIQKISSAVANVIDGNAILAEMDGEAGQISDEIQVEQERIRLEGQRAKRDRIKGMTFERLERMDAQRRGLIDEESVIAPPNLFQMPPTGGGRRN